MSECGSTEIRDALPEYLHQRVTAPERATIDAHLADCEECRLELAMLTSVREAMQERTPVIDTAAIVRALPKPQRRRTVRPWMLQLAAALSFISIGGVSLVVARSFYNDRRAAATQDSTRTGSSIDSVPKGSGDVLLAAASGRPGLTVGGGVTDLGADELELLLGALESLEAVPAAEPDDPLSQVTLRASGVR